MFSRIKAWFRSIIAEEVAKVSVSLTNERAESIAALKNLENEIARGFTVIEAAFQKRVQEMLEAEHSAFETRLRYTREHISDGEPNRWVASAEEVAANRALQKVK